MEENFERIGIRCIRADPSPTPDMPSVDHFTDAWPLQRSNRCNPPRTLQIWSPLTIVCLAWSCGLSSPPFGPPRRAPWSRPRAQRRGRLRLRQRHGRRRPLRLSRPRSPRGVTGFEVELMELPGAGPGRDGRFSQGQWDKLLQVLDPGRIDIVMNGYEWTETRRPRLPRDPALLCLSVAVDGPAGRPDPRLGRPEAAQARGRALDSRRAVGLGGRHVCDPSRAVRTSTSSGSTAPPTP